MAPQSPLTSKLKVHLKLTISRLRILQARDTAVAKQSRRAMASLLEAGKFESARIRVENIIRTDLTTELYEVLELYCELLLARIGLMEPPSTSSSDGSTKQTEAEKLADSGLEEGVRSLIFAAPKVDVKELGNVRALLVEKYGREFAQKTMEAQGVPERVTRKLRVEPPSSELVESYLKEIARAYDIRYGVEEEEETQGEEVDDEDDADGDSGGQRIPPLLEEPLLDAEPPSSTQELAKMTPPRDLGMQSPVRVAPPSPSTEKPNPGVKLPGAPELRPGAKMATRRAGGGAGALNGTAARATANNVAGTGATKKSDSLGDIPDVDDLEARFSRLKR